MTYTTRPSLLLRVRNTADTAAWQAFVDLYSPMIRQYATRRGLQPADADDLVQAVMAQVMLAIRGFDYDARRGSFRGWLGQVTANLLHKHWERVGRFPAGSVDAEVQVNGIDPEWNEMYTRNVLSVAMERIRNEFEPATWGAFQAVWVEECGPQEVALRLGLTLHAVYVAKSRVLKRLRTEVLLLADDLPYAGEP